MATGKKKQNGTDWARLARLEDSEIRKAVRADGDDAPIASTDWLRRAGSILRAYK